MALRWVKKFDDTFNRANTSPGAAGSTTGVGNGWIDQFGGRYSIRNNLVYVNTGYSGTIDRFLARPDSEAFQDQRATLVVPPQPGGPGNAWLAIRQQGAGTNNSSALAMVLTLTTATNTSAQIGLYYLTYGAATQIAVSGTFTYDRTHSYLFDLSATGLFSDAQGAVIVAQVFDSSSATPKVPVASVNMNYHSPYGGSVGVPSVIISATNNYTSSDNYFGELAYYAGTNAPLASLLMGASQ